MAPDGLPAASQGRATADNLRGAAGGSGIRCWSVSSKRPDPYDRQANALAQDDEESDRDFDPELRGETRPLDLIDCFGRAKAVLGALVGVLGFWKPGYFRSVQLSVSAAQTGVQQVLTDAKTGYGIANVRDVTCNGGTNPVVKKNAKFECEVTIDGTKRHVTATFSDDNGSYQVGQPK